MIKATPEQYRNATERILRYRIVKEKFPTTVTVPEGKTTYSEAEYTDAIKRVQKYIEENNGQFPPSIRFGEESAATISLYALCKTKTIQKGSTGQCVTYAQQKLQDFGFYGAKVDGIFGDVTKGAVITFQNATGHTPDGILGPKTWSSFPTYVISKPGVLKGDEWVLAEIRKRGTCNSMKDLRDIIAKYGVYLYYYDQQQSQATTVKTFKANCADWTNDVVLPVARALGLKSRGVHCQVKCSDGKWYGHYVAEVNGTLCDGAAWAKDIAYGKLICSNGYNFLHYEGDYIP